LNAVADGIVKGMQSFERRQQRRMQVNDPVRDIRATTRDKSLLKKK